LGLSIVSDLVRLMDGSIDFSSKVGHGTEFNFTVRMEPAQQPESREIDAVSFDDQPGLCYISPDPVLADIRQRQFHVWKLNVVSSSGEGVFAPEPGSIFIVEGSPNECARIGKRLSREHLPPQRQLFLVRGVRNSYREQEQSTYLYCPVYRRLLISRLQVILNKKPGTPESAELPDTIDLKEILSAAYENIESELDELLSDLLEFRQISFNSEKFDELENRAQHLRELTRQTGQDDAAALLFKLVMAARTRDESKVKKILSDLKNIH